MMPTLCTGCLAVVTLFSLTDCDAAPKTEVPITHRLSTTTLTCKVDPTARLRPVPRGLFGTNLEWFNCANSISDADGRVDPAWATLLREQGVDNIRFPGGTLSDFYFWRDGIGPVKKRPERDHPTDEGHSPNVMGTPEFLRFVAAAGARPLITVNAGTSTPDDAAAWVAYANQPDHPERRADGVPAGLRRLPRPADAGLPRTTPRHRCQLL